MLVPLPTDPTDIGLRLRRVAALTRARLGVAAISYDGALRCAVHCDADVLRAEVVARTLGKELAGVAALA